MLAFSVLLAAVTPASASESLACHVRKVADRTSFRACNLGSAPRATTDDLAFLRSHAKAFGLRSDAGDVVVSKIKRGLATRTTRFVQQILGVPVFGGWITVTRGRDGRVVSVHSTYRPRAAHGSAVPRLSSERAATLAQAAFPLEELRGSARAELAWYPRPDGGETLAWSVTLFSRVPAGDYFALVDADTGAILFKEDRTRRDVGSGFVYIPNPVQETADLTLRDRGDGADQRLELARREVLLRGLEPSTGLLRGEFADLSSLAGGLAVPDANEPDRVYAYDRTDPRFEQVVAYHTIDSIQRYIQSLGFDDHGPAHNGIRDFPTLADAHWASADQSFYSVGDDAIHLGDGGVDDGEDADLIAHEYGHAILQDQNSCLDAGETKAMSEGFGDYLAASFFADDGDSGYQATDAACIAEWDATAYSADTPPCLRRVDADKHYPDDLVGQIHADGEIWSRALWDLRTALGRRTADRLILEHHFTLPCDATMTDAALDMLQTDAELNDGDNDAAIREVFCARGILANEDCGPFPALTLTSTTEPLIAVAGNELEYVLVASNRGALAIPEVLLRDTVPAGTRYLPGSASDGGEPLGNDIVWPEIVLAPGGSALRTFRVVVDAGLAEPPIFSDDVEGDTAAWSTESPIGPFTWTVAHSRPRSGTGHWFAEDPSSATDQRLVLATSAPLPTAVVLRFHHVYDLEQGFDGAVVELSEDGDAWVDGAEHIQQHAYSGAIQSELGSSLAGRPAFTGSSDGYVESTVDLSDFEGESPLIRFRLVSDKSVAGVGWAIDDVEVAVQREIKNDASASATDETTSAVTLVTSVRAPACGDGIVQQEHGEQCDDGARKPLDCCTADCTFASAGAPCLDDDACNGDETCDGAGTCLPGSSPACTDLNPCTDDSCDAAKGCVHAPVAGNCSDGEPCNGEETCEGGECVPGAEPDCDDLNPCTDDVCAADIGCIHVANVASCGGDACLGAGRCRGGACDAAPILDCDDHDPCTDDHCDPEAGCIHTFNHAPCNDLDACNGEELCVEGTCTPGEPLTCEDHNPCTDGRCDPTLGCIYAFNEASCDDLNACNGSERCDQGICVAGLPLECDDHNPCTDDFCDVASGCVHLPNTSSCDDGDICSVLDACNAGHCTATDARRLRSASISVVSAGNAAGSRVIVRAHQRLSELSQFPATGGLDVFLLDGQLPVYFVRLHASGFEDSGGRNRKLSYRADDSGEGAEGVRRARIVRDALLDDLRIRVDIIASDLRLDELDAATLVLVFAPAASGDCTSAVAMPCIRSLGKLSCRSSQEP